MRMDYVKLNVYARNYISRRGKGRETSPSPIEFQPMPRSTREFLFSYIRAGESYSRGTLLWRGCERLSEKRGRMAPGIDGGRGRDGISRDVRFRNNRDFSIYPPKQTLRSSVTSDKTDASRRISDTRRRSSRSQIITRYDADARARAFLSLAQYCRWPSRESREKGRER